MSNGGLTIAGATIHTPLAKGAPSGQAFEPGSISEAMQLATLLVASRLLPRSVATPEAAFAIIATGRELGLTAMQSLRTIHVIEGKPTLSADLVLALAKARRDVCTYFMLVESTPQIATYRTQRVGEPEPTTMSFSMEDAQRAGVTAKDNWRRYPAAMLRARCITALVRAVYPDLAMGIYDPDELGGVPAAPPQAWQPEPAAAPAAQPATSQYVDLFAATDAAESAAALNRVAKDAQRAHRAGTLSDEQLQHIAKAVKAKRAALVAPREEVEGEVVAERGDS